MPEKNRIDTFSDIYTKNIIDDGSIDSSVIKFSRGFTFTLSGNQFSTTSLNTYQHLFDQSIYPSTLTSASGFAAFATSSNAFSGYYYTTIMQLYNRKLLYDWNGLFAITSLTSSTSSNFINTGLLNPNKAFNEFNNISVSSFSANVTGLYIFCFNKEIYGDHIHDGTLKLFFSGSSTAVAYDTYSFNNETVYSLTSNYTDTTSAITRFWVFSDIGKVICWSSNPSILDSFSAITKVEFRNALSIPNLTMNLVLQPDEFQMSDNPSYYLKNYDTGQLSDTFFTTIGLYNPWNELLAVCKLQKPIRKTNVPMTIKLVIDSF